MIKSLFYSDSDQLNESQSNYNICLTIPCYFHIKDIQSAILRSLQGYCFTYSFKNKNVYSDFQMSKAKQYSFQEHKHKYLKNSFT